MTACADNVNQLQPTGFRMLLDRSRFSHVAFFVQSVNHPGLTTGATENAFRRYSNAPQLPDTYTYGELTITVIVDEDMLSYTEMLNWMIQNVEEKIHLPGEEDPSRADLVLTILTSKNNVNKTITYKGAFPTAIGDIEFNTTADGGSNITYPITFSFDSFEVS